LLSLPLLALASSPCFLSCRLLSSHSSALMHALMRRLLPIHAHLCTHTDAPTRLALSLPSRMLTALPFCRCCRLFLFLFFFSHCCGRLLAVVVLPLTPLVSFYASSPPNIPPPHPST
jgi:hypothetical protein